MKAENPKAFGDVGECTELMQSATGTSQETILPSLVEKSGST
jgi:hypothetical protein